MGQGDTAESVGQVLLMDLANNLQMAAQLLGQPFGKQGSAILPPFAVANSDLQTVKDSVSPP